MEVFPELSVMITNCPVENEILIHLKNLSVSSSEEICGFITKDGDSYSNYISCCNVHPDKKNFFLINPLEYILDKDVILFHSHPSHSPLDGFSEWDIENQKYFCLDMLLYSVNKDKFYFKKYG